MTAANAALSLLELDGLVVSRRHGHFRFELSVEKLIVRAGEPVLIRGRNGSGKSTLMDVLGLVLRPDRAAMRTPSSASMPASPRMTFAPVSRRVRAWAISFN